MADLTVSADIDTFMGAANFAAARTALGVPGLATANTMSGANTFNTSVLLGNAALVVNSSLANTTLWNGGLLGWAPGAININTSTGDTALARLGAANLRLGLAPSATPIAQTLTIGESSRPGTDSNVAGANGTIQSGLGTGTGTPSSLIFQTPNAVGAGSSVQTYTTRLTITDTVASFAGGINSGTGSISCGSALSFLWASRSRMYSPADGVIQLTNNAGTDFTRLQFGGTTAAFPALRRTGATLETTLADASAFARHRALEFVTDAPVGGTAAPWRLGSAAAVTPTSPNRTIEVEIGGTTLYIHAKTTNN